MQLRSHALRLVPLLVGAVVLASCGGGDDEAASTTSPEREPTIALAEWADEVNQLCRAAETASEDLPEPESEEDWATLEEIAVESRRIVDDFVEDVQALGTPADEASAASDFIATYKDLDVVLADLQQAAVDEDPDAVNEAIAAGDELEAGQDRLAQDLELDDCWDPEEGSTDDGAATGVALAEWQAQVDAACAALNPQFNATSEIDTTSGDPAALQAYATGLNAFMTSTVAEFDRIGVPDDEAAAGTAQELYDVFTGMQAASQAMVDAVAGGDLDAAVAAAEEFDALAADANPLAEELQITSCGGF